MSRIGEPSEVEILRAAIGARIADVRTSIPAMVESYDAAKQVATVSLAVRLLKVDGTPEELNPLADVPVAWPRGGGYFVTMPLAKGDPGLLVFCEADFTGWRETGKVSDPTQERRHGLYCYFIPGGCVDGKEIGSADPTKLVIGKDGGNVIKIDGSLIELGASASSFAAKADLVEARLNLIQSKFDTHTHAVATTGSASAQSGTAAATTALIGSLASVAASKVKVQ